MSQPELLFLAQWENSVYPDYAQSGISTTYNDSSKIYISNKYGNPFDSNGNALVVDCNTDKNLYFSNICLGGYHSVCIEGWVYLDTSSTKNYSSAPTFFLFRGGTYRYINLYGAGAPSGNNTSWVDGSDFYTGLSIRMVASSSGTAADTLGTQDNSAGTVHGSYVYSLWHHIAITYSGAPTKGWDWYIDGKHWKGASNHGLSDVAYTLYIGKNDGQSSTAGTGVKCAFSSFRIIRGAQVHRCDFPVRKTRYTTTSDLNTTPIRLIGTKDGIYDAACPERKYNGTIVKGGKFNHYCISSSIRVKEEYHDDRDAILDIEVGQPWTISFWLYSNTNWSTYTTAELKQLEGEDLIFYMMNYYNNYTESYHINFTNLLKMRTLSAKPVLEYNSYIPNTDADTYTRVAFSSLIPEHKWVHIAIVNTGESTNYVRVFVNGTRVVNDQSSSRLSYWSIVGRNLCLNLSNDTLIDDFYVKIGEALWTANFTPPTEPFTKDPNWNIEDLSDETDATNISFNKNAAGGAFYDTATNGRTLCSVPTGNLAYIYKSTTDTVLYNTTDTLLFRYNWSLAIEAKYISNQASDWNTIFAFGEHYSQKLSGSSQDKAFWGIGPNGNFTGTFPDSNWHKYFLTYDAHTRKVYKFVDGRLRYTEDPSVDILDVIYRNLTSINTYYFFGAGNQHKVSAYFRNVLFRIKTQESVLDERDNTNTNHMNFITAQSQMRNTINNVDVTDTLYTRKLVGAVRETNSSTDDPILTYTNSNTHYAYGIQMEPGKYFQVNKAYFFSNNTTVEIYLYIDKNNLVDDSTIFAFTGSSVDNIITSYRFCIKNSELAFIANSSANGENTINLDSLSSNRYNVPFHLAWVYEVENNVYRFYINGHKVVSKSNQESISTLGPYSLLFGACWQSPNTFLKNSFTGTINGLVITPESKYTEDSFTIDITDTNPWNPIADNPTFDFHGVYIF